MTRAFNYKFCVLFLVLIFVFLVTAQTKGVKKSITRVPKKTTTRAPKTTTTPAPITYGLSCEMLYKTMYNNGSSSPISDEILMLMNEYNDLGKLLAPAPVTIGILSQLIIMADQNTDFPLNGDNPEKKYKYIEYPNSFRTTLTQISQRGYQALLMAHIKMDEIRVLNSAVPSDIKNAIKYLTSKNTRMIQLRLPPTLDKIKEAAKKSEDLSNEVVDWFHHVQNLTEETINAAVYTKSIKQKDLDDVKHSLNITNESKIFSETETLILKEKAKNMKEMLERLQDRKENINIKTTYGGTSFTINLAKDWVSEIGQDLYNKDKRFLHDTSQTWTYTYYDEFVESNPCAQQNSQHLFELISVFGDYRKNYQHWQAAVRNQSPFTDGATLINDIELELGKFVKCDGIESIIKKVNELLKKLKTPNVFQSKDKTTQRPFAKEIEDIVILINGLRDSDKVSQEYGKKVDVVTKSAWDIYGVSKRHQLDQLNSMSETVGNIINLNNRLMEIRNRKTRQILDKLKILDDSKSEILDVIRVLTEGLSQLGKLKENWTDLILFFAKIKQFVQGASRHSDALVEIVQTYSKTPEEISNNQNLFDELMSVVETSNEAVFLVKGVAENYVNVSDLYIKKRLTSLNQILTLSKGGGDNLSEQNKILEDAENDSRGIEEHFNRHRKELSENLHRRHQEIGREYNQLFTCMASDGQVNLADGYSFKLKSQMNGKVLNISSDDTVPYAQMWENGTQLWYMDPNRIIRSVDTDNCLTSNGFYPALVTVEPCQNNASNQKWTFENMTIVNIEIPYRCLSVRHSDKQNGVHIVEFTCYRNPNQLWDVTLQ